MTLEIHPLQPADLPALDAIDWSFTVDSRLVLDARDGRIHYTIAARTPAYTKRYEDENEVDYAACIGQPDKAIFVASVEGALAGRIILSTHWNKLAYVDGLAVDARFRRQGVGQALMRRGVEWAKSQALPGVMLETQDINVAACRFYARFGFELAGFDRCLYKAALPGADEIALYWYMWF